MTAEEEEAVADEEVAVDMAPNLVVIPVLCRWSRRRPPLQATSSCSQQQQLDDGLLDPSTPVRSSIREGRRAQACPYLSAPPNWGRESLVGGREKGWCAAVGEDGEGWGERERGGGGGLRAASLGQREMRGVV